MTSTLPFHRTRHAHAPTRYRNTLPPHAYTCCLGWVCVAITVRLPRHCYACPLLTRGPAVAGRAAAAVYYWRDAPARGTAARYTLPLWLPSPRTAMRIPPTARFWIYHHSVTICSRLLQHFWFATRHPCESSPPAPTYLATQPHAHSRSRPHVALRYKPIFNSSVFGHVLPDVYASVLHTSLAVSPYAATLTPSPFFHGCICRAITHTLGFTCYCSCLPV